MRLLPILAPALTACASMAPAERPYAALGTEPFWSIGIDGGRMTYETPDGGFSVPAPAPIATANGRRYETARITLDIRPWVCTDGMSDDLYADTVTAVVDGLTLHGCGGGIVAPDALAHSTWFLDEIDGAPVFEQGYTLEFNADRVSGRAGCNLFSGSYARAGDRLTIGPLTVTEMACPEPRMEHERRALQVLSGPVRLEFRDGGVLVRNDSTGTLLLRRSFHEPVP